MFEVARVLLRKKRRLGSTSEDTLNSERYMYMRKRRKQAGTVAAVVVSLGLLAAPLCSAVCADSSLLAFSTTEAVEPGSQSHHCHPSLAQPVSPVSPQPEHQSHNCENHQAALLLSGKGSLTVLSGAGLLQPYLPAPFTALLTGQTPTRHRGWQDSLKAPPRSPLCTILRI